jgi:hypothetical protein
VSGVYCVNSVALVILYFEWGKRVNPVGLVVFIVSVVKCVNLCCLL